MRNPYEYEPEDEPRVCATCARYFESDQLCNISSDMVKAIKERFCIMLADAEVAIDPKKITDCEGWVSAELHDRYALYRDKLEKRRHRDFWICSSCAEYYTAETLVTACENAARSFLAKANYLKIMARRAAA